MSYLMGNLFQKHNELTGTKKSPPELSRVMFIARIFQVLYGGTRIPKQEQDRLHLQVARTLDELAGDDFGLLLNSDPAVRRNAGQSIKRMFNDVIDRYLGDIPPPQWPHKPKFKQGKGAVSQTLKEMHGIEEAPAELMAIRCFWHLAEQERKIPSKQDVITEMEKENPESRRTEEAWRLLWRATGLAKLPKKGRVLKPTITELSSDVVSVELLLGARKQRPRLPAIAQRF